jgi:dethiobiotin synthetase
LPDGSPADDTDRGSDDPVVGGGCFVTATDTGVGKTVLAAAIVAGLAQAGVSVRARKPVLTGVSAARRAVGERLEGLDDDALLAALSGETPEEVSLARYEPAVSPHLAAAASGRAIDAAAIVAELRRVAAACDALVVEGIGGLLVPLSEGWDVRRLAAELALPVVVAARPGLGTLNHTLLTLEAARCAGLDVRAVVLTPWPPAPGELERSNRETIAALGAVEVATLPRLEQLSAATLAGAARGLRYERWLSS